MNFNDVLALIVVNIIPIACIIAALTIPMDSEYICVLLFLASFNVETEIHRKK